MRRSRGNYGGMQRPCRRGVSHGPPGETKVVAAGVSIPLRVGFPVSAHRARALIFCSRNKVLGDFLEIYWFVILMILGGRIRLLEKCCSSAQMRSLKDYILPRSSKPRPPFKVSFLAISSLVPSRSPMKVQGAKSWRASYFFQNYGRGAINRKDCASLIEVCTGLVEEIRPARENLPVHVGDACSMRSSIPLSVVVLDSRLVP